ncbi:hypothetical protein SUGI_0460290 [Cryptomeria japonica]|nr:hypothetical protein SUGI_0460290 [Cryptomeria japonica]
MHWEIVFRFSICICLMGFAAAKCDPEICGSVNVSYPFWINNSQCGYPGFQIICKKDNSTGMMAPLFEAFLGYLIINSTSLKVQSCKLNSSASSFFQPHNGGPFTISMSNKFVVIGCNTFGTYTYGNLGNGKCTSLCREQSDPQYCRYGCCEVSVPDNLKWFNFSGGGVFGLRNSTTNNFDNKCAFSTILDPSTFTVVDNETSLFWGGGRKAYYGLRLNWGIGLQSCSMARSTANYSCSINAECIGSSSKEGHVCRCLPGYQGNGCPNGTDCTDIDECSDKELNMCVGADEGGICHNLGGSYNCSCANAYMGDG